MTVCGPATSAIEPRPTKVICPPSLSLTQLGRGMLELYSYRDLMLTLSSYRIRVRYKQSRLGIVWALLQPAALMLIYTVVFSKVTQVPTDGTPYAVFSFAALLLWSCFSSAVTGATNGMVTNTHFVTKVYFPREILPLSYIVTAVFDFLLGSTLLALLMFHYRLHIHWGAMYGVAVLLLAVVFTIAVSLFLSAAQVRLRDFGLALPLFLQFWMFASPVVYPLSAVPVRLQKWYVLNPMVGVVENFRRVVLQGQNMEWRSFGMAALVTAILLPLSYWFFKRMESTIADVI